MAQQNLARNSTDQDEESMGPWFHPNRDDNLLRVGFFSSLGTQKAKKFLCSHRTAFPTGRTQRPHHSLSLLPASSPHQHPITSRASLLPLTPLCNSCLLRSRVLFWFTAHLASTQEPKDRAGDKKGKLLLWKTGCLWAKGQESLLKR